MHPDATSGLIRAERRPINSFELADLERQGEAAVASARREQRGRMPASLLIGGAISVVVLWASGAPSIVGASVAIGVSTLAVRRSRRRTGRARADWTQRVAEAKLHPVEHIDIAPLRAWSCGKGWIFDLGGGVGFFAEFDIPGGSPKALLTWRKARGCVVWIDQSGVEVPCDDAPVPVVPLHHPLCRMTGPVVFSLDSKDPIGSLLRFEGGHSPVEPS
ncbi:MAG: hypothetical protein FJW38_03500 [Acidobacteria bacterium]|nr:hypothetical protein [Acidobacteriota bacterium]